MRSKALRTLLEQILGEGRDSYRREDAVTARACRLASEWVRGRTNATDEVERLLTQHGFDLHSITAQAFAANVLVIERFDRLIAAADVRRDSVLRGIDRRRESLARQLRAVCQNITDVEEAAPVDEPAIIPGASDAQSA
jgi:hypothetical protein